MKDSKVEKEWSVRGPRIALLFGILSAALYFLAVKALHSTTATAPEVAIDGLFIGVMGFASWLWWPVSTFFLLLLGATIVSSRLLNHGVNWVNAGVLLFPCMIPFVLFAIPDFLRWWKRARGPG